MKRINVAISTRGKQDYWVQGETPFLGYDQWHWKPFVFRGRFYIGPFSISSK